MKKLNEKELKSVNGGASKNKTSKPASASQNVYSRKPPKIVVSKKEEPKKVVQKKVVPKKVVPKPSKTVADTVGNKRQTK